MSAKSLQMIAACVPAKRGPARGALDENRRGVVIHMPPVQTGGPQTSLDRFMMKCEKGGPNPLDRSPDNGEVCTEED